MEKILLGEEEFSIVIKDIHKNIIVEKNLCSSTGVLFGIKIQMVITI